MPEPIAGTIRSVLVNRRTWSLVLISCVALFGTVSGCASDGRTMREPAAWQTTTTRPSPPTSAPISEISETGLSLTSPNFEPGDTAPVETTCDGGNKPPSLEWSDVPEAAVELAITLTDQSDPEDPLLLWLVAGISPQSSGLASGELPNGVFETLNDYGNLGFGQPCISATSETKRDLQFRLYVLEHQSGLAPGEPGNEAWDTLNAAATDSASLLMRISPQPEP